MNVVLSGKGAADAVEEGAVVHKVLRPGYTLVVGSECNDGRPISESWRYNQAVKMGLPIQRKKIKIPKVGDPIARTSRALLVNKYAPRNLGEVIGHKECIQQLRSWLGLWEKGAPEVRGALVTGPPGIGKTTAVHLVAQSLGYKVVEYNASDTRSISVLRGMIALGIRRLQREVIVMDEVDGLSERGGTGELASILKKTCVPIVCIANEKPPKLRPIVNACVDIPFRRPLKSVIAAALEKVTKAEGLRVSRADLEALCESSGNDIRSILNKLEFYEDKGGSLTDKDTILRMDIFSATQSLFRGKRMGLDEAAGLVFVDYHMVPLMVQEGYLAACGDDLEAAAKAAEHLSFGDVLDRRIHAGQDWGLIPDFVQCSVAAARVAPGLAPFQLFPQWLGKNSKGMKHARYMRELGEKTGRRRGAEMRLDYVTPLQTMMFGPLGGEKADIKGVMTRMDDLGWTRDDVMENLQEVCLEAMEVPTKVKTAFTREYNKTHKGAAGGKKRTASGDGAASEEEEEEGDGMDAIEEGMEELEL